MPTKEKHPTGVRPLKWRPRILAYWIAKRNHIFHEIAERTNKKYDSVYLQLRRGNPRWKDRGTYADTISGILGVDRISETMLFSPASENQAIIFISGLVTETSK